MTYTRRPRRPLVSSHRLYVPRWAGLPCTSLLSPDSIVYLSPLLDAHLSLVSFIHHLFCNFFTSLTTVLRSIFPVILHTLAEPSSPPLACSLIWSFQPPSTCAPISPSLLPDSSKAAVPLSRIIPCSSSSSFSLPLPFFTKIVPVCYCLLASSPFTPARSAFVLFLLLVSKEKAGVGESDVAKAGTAAHTAACDG